jgi:hypothetical protein
MQTTTMPRQGSGLRRLALLLAAAIAALAAVTFVAPSPAHAATSIRYCFEIPKKTPFGWIWVKHCFDVPLAYNPNPCCIYDYGIDFGVDPALPEEIEHGYLEDVAAGLGLLGQARASDPRTASVLRARAQEEFLGAARVLRGAKVTVEQVGYSDIKNYAFEPMPLPWLESAAADVADGLALMQRALTDPLPHPSIEAGMKEFEQAAAQFAAPKAE